MKPRILVAGVGNIFLGDDAFGVEVALLLSQRKLSAGVLVKDFGIRGFDLAYTLLEPWTAVILVDALPRGDAPGTLYVMEPDLGSPALTPMALNPHSMDPVRVLNLAASIGTISAQVLILGCEPNDFGDEFEGRMGLSAPVQAVIEEAADKVEEIVGRILASSNSHPEQLQMSER